MKRKRKLIAFLALAAFLQGTAFARLPSGPLQAYDYGELRLVRIMPDEAKQPRACFATVDGKVYWARRGSVVGKGFGTVKAIEGGYVVIADQVELTAVPDNANERGLMHI